VNRDLTGDEISLGWKNVAILSDSNDVTRMFELTQRLSNRDPLVALQSELAGDLDFIERAVIFPSKQF
jgi:hypothetical protein